MLCLVSQTGRSGATTPNGELHENGDMETPSTDGATRALCAGRSVEGANGGRDTEAHPVVSAKPALHAEGANGRGAPVAPTSDTDLGEGMRALSLQFGYGIFLTIQSLSMFPIGLGHLRLP